MGSKTTKLFKNTTPSDPKTQNNNGTQGGTQGHNQHNHNHNHDNQQPNETIVKNPISPFVYYRRGSMYIDEDGDIAHEFYIETKEGSKLTLKRISNQHLTPQGDVPLEVPCISNDYPVVLLDHNRSKE